MHPSKPITIYLAGPDVFRKDVQTFSAALKAICEQHGALGLFPLDNAIQATDGMSLPRAIALANEDMIRSADAVVANMDPFRGPSMDSGTAYEMGFARALGRLVVGYTSDQGTYLQKVCRRMHVYQENGAWWDNYDMQVESFPDEMMTDNLMMASGAAAIMGTFEEAVIHVVKALRSPAAAEEQLSQAV